MEKSVLEGKVASELHTIAAGLGIGGHQKLKKAELVDAILAAAQDGHAAADAHPSPPRPAEASALPAEQPTQASDNGESTADNGESTAPPTRTEPREVREPG